MDFLRDLIRPAAELPEANVCLVGLPLDFGTVLKGGRAGAYALAVSAPSADGFTPRQAVEAAFLAGRQQQVRPFEVVEINPLYDRDNQKVRLAATIITAFITGVAASLAKSK